MPTPPNPGSSRSRGTILIAEDFQPARRLLTTILTNQGYRVLAASGGEEALAMAANDPPDLVVTDLKMPDGDGIALCEALKKDPATRLIPVVIMTGSSEAGDRMRAIEVGAADFLTKPVETMELEARVRSLVNLKHFTDDLDTAEAVLRSLALTIEARDKYTQGHCERLASYAETLGDRARPSG